MNMYPSMYVEGPDDCFSLQALLEENGIRLTKDDGPVIIQQTKSVDTLLNTFEINIKTAQGNSQPVAFVLDIDENLSSRWESIRNKLNAFGAHLAGNALTSSGLIVDFPRGKVGVWLMPDNIVTHGKLEDFLRTLIKSDDPCISASKAFVHKIGDDVAAGVRFKDKDAEKAEMSAWLSVQNEPGLPYGTAIKSRILASRSPVADLFVQWFKGVFAL